LTLLLTREFKEGVMTNMSYYFYMAEAEGFDNLVNTREAKLNAIIKDLRGLGSRLAQDPDRFLEEACLMHNIEPTPAEIKYIERGVNK
jgi:hypothetical protein